MLRIEVPLSSATPLLVFTAAVIWTANATNWRDLTGTCQYPPRMDYGGIYRQKFSLFSLVKLVANSNFSLGNGRFASAADLGRCRVDGVGPPAPLLRRN